MHYKLSRVGDVLLLSHPRDLKQVYESPKYLRRMPMDFNDYVYGRVAGYKDGRSIYASSNGYGERSLLMRNIYLQAVSRQGMFSYFPAIIRHSRDFVAKLIKNSDNKKYDPLEDIRVLSNGVMCELDFGRFNCERDPDLTEKLFDAMNAWVDSFGDFLPFVKPFNSWFIRY